MTKNGVSLLNVVGTPSMLSGQVTQEARIKVETEGAADDLQRFFVDLVLDAIGQLSRAGLIGSMR